MHIVHVCVQELIEKHVCKQRELESLHMEHLAEIDALDKKVNELTNINESLRSEHSELQGRFVEHERHRSFPVSRYCCIGVCVVCGVTPGVFQYTVSSITDLPR